MVVRVMDNTLDGSGYDAPGAGSSSAAADPNLMMRLWNYINPVTTANARTADSVTLSPNPLNNPSPVDPRLAGGGPPVPQSLTGPPPAPQDLGPAGSNMPFPNQIDPRGYWAPRTAQPVPPVVGGARPRIRTPGGAVAPAAAGNPSGRIGPDNTFTYVVPNSQQGRTPIYTAGNFDGLFGGRGGVNPNVPAANAQPVAAPAGGVLAKGGMSNAPWFMGPFQQGIFGPSANDLAAAKARSGYQ